jgi:hypothetical protein
LERLDALARAALPDGAGAVDLTPALLAALQWTAADAERVLRALGFVRVRSGEGAEATLWRRRSAPAAKAPADIAATPFAALAALAKPSPRAGRRARRVKARRRVAIGRNPS